MMYKTDMGLLPDSVLEAVVALRAALLVDTDFEHIQLTLNEIRMPEEYNETMHVIVKDKDGPSQ